VPEFGRASRSVGYGWGRAAQTSTSTAEPLKLDQSFAWPSTTFYPKPLNLLGSFTPSAVAGGGCTLACPAPGSIRGTVGQHRNDGSRREGWALIRTGSKNAAMLSQLPQEVLVALPKNGVLAGMACKEATPGYSRSLHLSINNKKTSKAHPQEHRRRPHLWPQVA
jgi:hypothetical protein